MSELGRDSPSGGRSMMEKTIASSITSDPVAGAAAAAEDEAAAAKAA